LSPCAPANSILILRSRGARGQTNTHKQGRTARTPDRAAQSGFPEASDPLRRGRSAKHCAAPGEGAADSGGRSRNGR